VQIVISEAKNPFDDLMGLVKEIAYVLERFLANELPEMLRDWLLFKQMVEAIDKETQCRQGLQSAGLLT